MEVYRGKTEEEEEEAKDRSAYQWLMLSIMALQWLKGAAKTKHFDQCGSHDDKNTLYFGGLGQITDTITRFWSMNEMFWVSNYILHTCNKVLKFQQTVVTFALTV